MADEIVGALEQSHMDIHRTMNRAVVLANSDEDTARQRRKLDALSQYSRMIVMIEENELKAVKDVHE